MSGWPSRVTATAVCFGLCGVLVAIPADPEVVYAEVALPADTDITGYGIHPALLDAALHPLAAVFAPHHRGRWRAGRGFRSRSPGSPCMPPRPPGCMSS